MIDVGRFGIWTFDFDQQPLGAIREAMAEVEELGYGAIWVPEAMGREAVSEAALLLGTTTRLVIANGIARIGARDPRTMAAAHRALTEAYPGRHLLGLGGSTLLADVGPLEGMRRYLDAMDAAAYLPPPPSEEPARALAALGPAMLRLAAERTSGAHTYLVSPEHTAFAREHLGLGPLLAAEQAVVLETDPTTARTIGRRHLELYLSLPQYHASFLRMGFTEDDLVGGGSDRLIDAIVGWGDLEAVIDRLRAHLDAGADHVCIQVLAADAPQLPLEAWRHLAVALLP